MGRNEISGYVAAAGDTPDAAGVSLAGIRLDEPHDRPRPGLALFAHPGASVQVAASPVHDACAYLWGKAAHERIPEGDLAEACAGAVARQQFAFFRELLGTFVAIVDEPWKGRVTIVSDALGIRPLFLSPHRGGYVFGSNVWALHGAGLIDSSIDYDAVSAWLAYGFNCTGGSLFHGVRRVPPGSAVVIERGRATTIEYGAFQDGCAARTFEQAADDIHEIVSSDTRTLLSADPRLVVPLSGGFDSRYLLALTQSGPARATTAVSVGFSPAEERIAVRVAATLNLPLETIPVEGSEWDLYDDVHHFMPDGFPVSKFVTYCIAQNHPGIPLLNGFLGDSLVRGSHHRYGGREEHDCGSDLAGVLQQKHLGISANLLRPQVRDHVLWRARLPMVEMVQRGGARAFEWADLYLRQRLYISNNFLQHLDSSEAILPFYSRRLIAYKLAHAREAFSRETYRAIFARHFPGLAAVPHASELPGAKRVAMAACTVRWARELMNPLMTRDWLPALSRRHCVPLVAAAATRLPSLNRHAGAVAEDAVFTCRRMYLLERRLRAASRTLDWSAL